MPITLPYTHANGQSADATEVMANFQAVVDYPANGIPNADLAAPKAQFALTATLLAAIAAGASERVIDCEVPSGQTWVITGAQFVAVTITGTTVALDVTDDGVSLFSTTFTTTTADTVQKRTSFATSSIAAGSRIKATLSATGGTSAEDFYVTLFFKVVHQS